MLQELRKLTGAVPAAGGLPAVEVRVPSVDSSLYTHVEVEQTGDADLGAPREYNIDLAPKVHMFSHDCYTVCARGTMCFAGQALTVI